MAGLSPCAAFGSYAEQWDPPASLCQVRSSLHLMAATPYAQESTTIHQAGTQCPCVPWPALPQACLPCAPSLLGTPQGFPCIPLPQCTPSSLWMQYQLYRSCRTPGVPIPSQHIKVSCLHAVPPTTSGPPGRLGAVDDEGVRALGCHHHSLS